ncbi:ABC transporter permease [Haloglycomyces albus]|uniref:ABC transporter permease n=1 Tax=Haloglycomyces albus TaxID=526067 RepID=UPI0004B0EAB0|nr:ABC transporter permease [Haloglycomyces albus]
MSSDNPTPTSNASGAPQRRPSLDETGELPRFLDSSNVDEPSGPGTTSQVGMQRQFPLTTGLTAVFRHRHALSTLVRRDLAVKYQSTVMGYFWSLVEPLGMAVVYYFVFALVFGRGTQLPNDVHLVVYIISGIFVWQWFSSAVSQGAGSLNGQSALITVMKVPREVFPLSKVLARFAEYLAGFPIIIVAAVLGDGVFGWNLLWIFPAILLQAMILTGFAFMLAAGNVLYRDVQRFLPLFMRILFYASAILFPLSRVQNALQNHPTLWFLYEYNPLVVLFQMHRAVWIPGLAPNQYAILSVTFFAIIVMFLGRWIFYKLEPQVLKAL